MYKEIIIILIIVISIFVGDFITQKHTQKIVGDIDYELNELKQKLEQKLYDEARKKVDEVESKIDKVHHKISYYIEHQEIEKIETKFEACKSLVKLEEYELAIKELDLTIFSLKRMEDKYSFNLDNIF